jgi:quaternary ammonium compound-resistance protein SugE
MTWIALFLAAAFEIVWALALKRSDGLTQPLWAVLFGVAAVLSMGLLAVALRHLPVGTAYAIWTGTGAVGTALLGMALLGDPVSAGRVSAIALIAGGIVWLALAG